MIGYYEAIYNPAELNRHYFWCNFLISQYKTKHTGIGQGTNEMSRLQNELGFNVTDTKLLRNCTEPELGLHILNCAKGIYQHTKDVNQIEIFN